MAGRDAVFGVRRRRYDPVLRLYLSQAGIRHSVNVLFRVNLSDANAPYNCSGAASGPKPATACRTERLRHRCFSPSRPNRAATTFSRSTCTHKERDTGEVTLRKFKLLKFCARGLGQMLRLIRRVR